MGLSRDYKMQEISVYQAKLSIFPLRLFGAFRTRKVERQINDQDGLGWNVRVKLFTKKSEFLVMFAHPMVTSADLNYYGE